MSVSVSVSVSACVCLCLCLWVSVSVRVWVSRASQLLYAQRIVCNVYVFVLLSALALSARGNDMFYGCAASVFLFGL